MSYRSRIKVRFSHVDHAQVVYFPRFFDYFHQVFEDFCQDQGCPYREMLDGDWVGWPAVHAECDYKAPLRLGDTLVVDLQNERIGATSATFRYQGLREADGSEVAQARIVVACIDMRTWGPQPIPSRYRTIFEGIQLSSEK